MDKYPADYSARDHINMTSAKRGRGYDEFKAILDAAEREGNGVFENSDIPFFNFTWKPLK